MRKTATPRSQGATEMTTTTTPQDRFATQRVKDLMIRTDLELDKPRRHSNPDVDFYLRRALAALEEAHMAAEISDNPPPPYYSETEHCSIPGDHSPRDAYAY